MLSCGGLTRCTALGQKRAGTRQGCYTAYLQVALVCVKHSGLVPVVRALKLHRRMVYGGLEVAVLSIHHQPHVGLFSNTPYDNGRS